MRNNKTIEPRVGIEGSRAGPIRRVGPIRAGSS